MGIKAVFLALWRVLAFAGKHLGLGIKAVFLVLWRVLAFAGKYLGLGIKAVFLALWRVLAFTGKYLGISIKAIFLMLWRVLAFAGKYLGMVIKAVFLMLWRVLAFVGKYLGLAISIPFIYLGKGIAWTVKSQGSGVALLLRGLLLGPIRELAFASRPVGRAVSGFFQNQATGLQSLGRYLWATAYTMGHDLQAGLPLLGRYAAGTLAASPRYARAGLIFGLSNLVVAAGVLVFSPLILVRLMVDQGFRRRLAARSGRLWGVLKARPAVGLLCLGGPILLGLVFLLVPQLVWPSLPTVEVLLWTSEEKQNVLGPALTRFNEGSPTVTVDGRRYRVRAHSVTVDSADMHAYLVAKLDRGTALPLEIGFPTVVSPANSGLLGQINLDTGLDLFELDQLRPIARTPVVIVARRGTAECLGWPQQSVGWADIIAHTDNPEVWAACPAAGSDWGKQPRLDFGDPATSSTARTALQALHLVAAGKLAEEFFLEDLEGPWVEELLTRVRAASEPSALGSGGLQPGLNLALAPGHLQLVEEYQVAQYYLRLSGAGAGPELEPNSEIVAIYPREGTMWHDNPYGIVDATWVSPEQREAALLLQQHLRSRQEQERFMEDGFRPGIYLEPREVLTPTRGLNLKQPQTFLGRLSPEVAQAIQDRWESEISR